MHILIYLLALLFTITSCNKKQELPKNPSVPITVFEIEPQNVPAVLQAVGTVQSSHMVDIRARVEGYLDRIAYTEGSLVKMGDLLFQIDPRPFQASLDSANAELSGQKAILWNATKTRNRLEPLYEAHAISERDLDNAIASQLSAQAQVESAQANVRTAELNFAYTTIQAPIDGITSQANYREGSLITQSLPKPLTTVSAIDPIWVNFSISENSLLEHQKAVKAGFIKDPSKMSFEVQIILADGSIYPYTGYVNFLEPFYDQNTGTLNVRTTFPNPNAILKPNQFVQVKVSGASYIDAMIVPQRAVVEGGKGKFVYLVGPDNTAEISLVDVGDWWDNYWIIRTGLKKGDRVVVDGVNKIEKGSPLIITKTLPQPEPSQ